MRRWIVPVVLGACGGGGGNECTPGASVACTCTSGGNGAQVCLDDGTFGACECAVDAATPDATSPMRTFQISGHITVVSDPQAILGIAVGDPFTGSYTYDMNATDSVSDPTVGSYAFTMPTEGLHLSVNGETFETDPDATPMDYTIQIADHDNNGGDIYVVNSNTNRTSGNRFIEVMFWELDDADGSAITSDTLPSDPPTLGDFSQLLQMVACATDPAPNDCQSEASQAVIRGTVESISP